MSQRSTTQNGKAPLDAKGLSPSVLEHYFRRLFELGDLNGDGVIDPSEMEELLRQSGFQFDDRTIAEIMAVADTNGDGVIEYKEFVPLMTALLV